MTAKDSVDVAWLAGQFPELLVRVCFDAKHAQQPIKAEISAPGFCLHKAWIICVKCLIILQLLIHLPYVCGRIEFMSVHFNNINMIH